MSGEDSWVFDSLVCFLHGPIWNAPLQTFIEEKSLMFDPNVEMDVDNPIVKEIYEDYKNLVDYMLGSFMEEMQITPEQFEQVCMESRQQQIDQSQQQQTGIPFHFHQALFQQIWAANDIKIFIRMMTQRNVELQLQALDLIEKSQLTLLQDNEHDNNNDSTAGPMSESQNAMQSASLINTDDPVITSLEEEAGSSEVVTASDMTADSEDRDVNDKFQRLNLFFEKDEVDPDELLSRQEYLREQRDKIIELKKKTRAKQLEETLARSGDDAPATSDNEKLVRPSSAQVAQKLLENGSDPNFKITTPEDPESNNALKLRKTLAKRLKAEVVDHQN